MRSVVSEIVVWCDYGVEQCAAEGVLLGGVVEGGVDAQGEEEGECA